MGTGIIPCTVNHTVSFGHVHRAGMYTLPSHKSNVTTHKCERGQKGLFPLTFASSTEWLCKKINACQGKTPVRCQSGRVLSRHSDTLSLIQPGYVVWRTPGLLRHSHIHSHTDTSTPKVSCIIPLILINNSGGLQPEETCSNVTRRLVLTPSFSKSRTC